MYGIRFAARSPMRRVALAVLGLTTSACTGGLTPYAPDRLEAADYARAERFLSWNTIDRISGVTVAAGREGAIEPTWLDADRFWYDVQTERGHRFVLVDPASRTRGPAFDHAHLAAVLTATGQSATADSLPFRSFTYLPGDSIGFTLSGHNVRFLCPLSGPTDQQCRFAPFAPSVWVPSPDGSHQAFVRDHNLWVAGPTDTVQLSRDGVYRFGYATTPHECCNAVQSRLAETPTPPILAWSPDGRKIVTHRYDERNVADLYLLQTTVGRPVLHSYPYALPGDTALPRYQYHVFDVASRRDVLVDAPPMLDGFPQETFPIQWSADSEELYFTRHTEDYRRVDLVFADPSSGRTRVILVEEDSTFVDLNQVFPFLPPNWRVVRHGDAVIWFSERSGWGHLYLHDTTADSTATDPLPITSGDWLVLNIEYIDEQNEWIYLSGVGREPDVDPYLPQLYRVHYDGTDFQRLTQEPADHAVAFSPSGKYIVDTYSTRFEPSVTVLRNSDGEILMELERANIDPLVAEGWQMPVPFRVKAADGETDLYGFLHFPSQFDAGREYPVVDFVYPGPQTGPILTRSFTVQPFGDVQALAELGFIVVTVDARGTPHRSKAFHDFDYGRFGDNAIDDHIATLRQLDELYPQLDLSRVGIYGHSGGGAAAAAAMLKRGDFFRVGIAAAGNHDDRSYYFPWGNKYQGTDTARYALQANQDSAQVLDGRLLITYGTMDDNVHPTNSLLLIDSLIANNRDFDVLVLPNRSHDYISEPYAIRRVWDYLVRHLLGAEPPRNYYIRPPPDPAGGPVAS